jgi:hypothetical protein
MKKGLAIKIKIKNKPKKNEGGSVFYHVPRIRIHRNATV